MAGSVLESDLYTGVTTACFHSEGIEPSDMVLFDTLDHRLLLEKLTALGFSKASVQWFNAYLTDRLQSVVVNGLTSDPQSICFGVPQGSLIGPYYS